MDSELYYAAVSGDVDFLSKRDWSFFFEQETVEKNSALHLAAKFKQKQFAEKIIASHPQLQYKKNSKEDTPLHIAARVGCLEIAERLASDNLDTESQQVEALRMVNSEKDTALHIAVRNGHSEIVDLLIQKEKELTKFVNANGESPLFLAVDRNLFSIAHRILQDDPNCSYQGRKRMNVLHAAILRTSKGHLFELKSFVYWLFVKIFAWVLTLGCSYPALKEIYILVVNYGPFKRSAREGAREGFTFLEAFIKKFPNAIKESDEFGWTPLHYAAFLGNTIAVKLLLKINDEQLPAHTYVYHKDKEGLSAFHIAAKEGRVQVMKEFTKTFPDIYELVDERGRTALHVAVENRMFYAVRYVLKTPSLEGLINVQDTEGNTSLHLAAIHGHYGILNNLLNDTRVDKKAINKEGFTAIKLIESEMELTQLQKFKYATKLRRVGGLQSLEGILTRENREKENEKEREGMVVKNSSEDKELIHFKRAEKIASTHILVATIIATVTFAAGFTMPGGYKSDGPDEGKANFSRKTAFKSFLIFDTIAFCFSAISMLFYFAASIQRNRHSIMYVISWAGVLTYYSLVAMVIAFISGTNVVLARSSGLAIANIALGCCFFLFVYFILFTREYYFYTKKKTNLK